MASTIKQTEIISVPSTALAPPCHPLLLSTTPPGHGFLRLLPSEPAPSAPYVAVVPLPPDHHCCPDLLPLDADEDCISLRSYGSASCCSGRSAARRVTFAATLVTAVHTRPRTRDGDKRRLFYTQSETDRFRQVYREERQSSPLAMLQPDSSDKEPPSSEISGRHRISRVVVEYNESLATFYDPDDYCAYSLPQEGASVNDVFFDNDSFWSGSISWY